MITIENDLLSASVNFKGAELSSLKKKSSSTEYIWQADPAHWARHAPILFPIVGRLRNDEYVINKKRYSLTQHGFARDMEFEVVEHEKDMAVFQLKSTLDTRLAYPFKFLLIVSFQLHNNDLTISYEVVNKSGDAMYFSIGGHPAFNCPVFPGTKKTEYSLEFDEKETAFTQRLEDGLRTNDQEKILENERKIPITESLFDHDALIFDQLKSKKISLVHDGDTLIELQFEGFPYLGIWSKSAEAPFVCIEPWFGVADRVDHDYDFTKKEGILSLEPKSCFTCSYLIKVH